MNESLKVLALCALPALGNLAGGLVAELLPVSKRMLSFALHAAAGIILGVVGVELMPQALAATRPWSERQLSFSLQRHRRRRAIAAQPKAT